MRLWVVAPHKGVADDPNKFMGLFDTEREAIIHAKRITQRDDHHLLIYKLELVGIVNPVESTHKKIEVPK